MQVLEFQVELLVVQQRLRYHFVLHFSLADKVFHFQTILLCIDKLQTAFLHFHSCMQILVYNGCIYLGHKLLRVGQFPVDNLLGHMKSHYRNSHFYIYRYMQQKLDCIEHWLNKDCSSKSCMAYHRLLSCP